MAVFMVNMQTALQKIATITGNRMPIVAIVRTVSGIVCMGSAIIPAF
jgi:hypothetical protein